MFMTQAAVVIVALLGTPTAVSVRPGPSVQDTCDRHRFATVALGDALSHVRAARIFADESSRRQALAELEILLINQIQAEADSNYRNAAWLGADDSLPVEAARRTREDEEGRADGAPTDALRRERLQARFTYWYRYHLEHVLKLVDPRSPRRCAADSWSKIHAQALRAEAL